MATIKEIRNKMLSIQNIEKLTKTMERVATAKVNQKKSALERFRLFSDEWIYLYKSIEEEATVDLESRLQKYPLFHHTSDAPYAVFAITSNRGLCGAYNQHILTKTKSYLAQLNKNHIKNHLYMMGNKGIQHFNYHQLSLEKAIYYFNESQLQKMIYELSNKWINQYLNNEIGQLDVIYTAYLSAGKQITKIKRVLPLDNTNLNPFKSIAQHSSKQPWNLLFLHEPDINRVLDAIIHKIVQLQLYSCVVDSMLSEEIQRKIAMKQASESAYDMISQLRLSYNRARQEKITKELIEIMGTVKAL